MEIRLDFCVAKRRDALSVSRFRIFVLLPHSQSENHFIAEARNKNEHSDDMKSKLLMECYNIFTSDDTSIQDLKHFLLHEKSSFES